MKETGLKVPAYEVVTEYPYRWLLLYHAALRRHFAFEDADAARRYFQTHNPTQDSHCPSGREGQGVYIFGRSPATRPQPWGEEVHQSQEALGDVPMRTGTHQNHGHPVRFPFGGPPGAFLFLVLNPHRVSIRLS